MDASKLQGISFIGSIGDGKSTACLMSARALLDGRKFGDEHPSNVLRSIGVALNDGPWWENDEHRTAVLLPVALDPRLCASQCDASELAEKTRTQIVKAWAFHKICPIALDGAARITRPVEAYALRSEALELSQLKVAVAGRLRETDNVVCAARLTYIEEPGIRSQLSLCCEVLALVTSAMRCRGSSACRYIADAAKSAGLLAPSEMRQTMLDLFEELLRTDTRGVATCGE